MLQLVEAYLPAYPLRDEKALRGLPEALRGLLAEHSARDPGDESAAPGPAPGAH